MNMKTDPISFDRVRLAWTHAHVTYYGTEPHRLGQYPLFRRGTIAGSIVLDARLDELKGFGTLVHLVALQLDCWVAPDSGEPIAVLIPHVRTTRSVVETTVVEYPMRPYLLEGALSALAESSVIDDDADDEEGSV